MLKRVILILFLLTLLTPLSFSKFQQFSEYNTQIIFNEDSTITVKNEIHLRNVHSVGIVPGEFEFELYSYEDYLEILDFNVKDSNSNDITTRLIENDNKTSLVMNLFTPILPGFEYVVHIDYTFEYSPSGLLFKRLEIPLIQNTSLPILSGDFIIQLEENKRFTYVSHQTNTTNISKNNLSLKIDNTSPDILLVEYSIIPLRLWNYPGSLIFWILVNIIIITLLIYQLRTEFRKLSQEEEIE